MNNIKMLLTAWALAFVFTLVVELPVFVAVAILRTDREVRPSIKRLLLAGAAGTCVTHPLLWFVWPFAFDDYATYIITGELIVAALESISFWAIARPIRLTTAIAASFLANAASFALGQFLV